MPKVVNHEQRRELLATTAGQLIAKQGVAKATVRNVARRAGVSTGTVSHYYSDSRELLFAAYQLAFRTSAARFVMAMENDSSFEGLLKAIANALPCDDITLSEWRVRMAFWGVSDYADDIQQFEQAAGSQFRQLISDRLKALAREKTIRLAVSPVHAARSIEGLLTGTAIQRLVSPGAESSAIAVKRLREQVRRGVLQE